MGCIYMVNGCGLKKAGARSLCCSSVLENKGYTEAERAFLELIPSGAWEMGVSASRERLKPEQSAGVTRKWSIPHLKNQRLKKLKEAF